LIRQAQNGRFIWCDEGGIDSGTTVGVVPCEDEGGVVIES
jgi:hypothetical protein